MAVTAELDLMKVNLIEARLIAVRLKIMRLGRKFKNSFKSIKIVESDLFTLGVKLAFTKLRQAFVKTPILQHFDPEHHIQIETDVSG